MYVHEKKKRRKKKPWRFTPHQSRRDSRYSNSSAVHQKLSESAEVVPSPRPGLELCIHREEIPDLRLLSPLRLPARPSLFQLLGLLRPVWVVDAVLAARAVLPLCGKGGREGGRAHQRAFQDGTDIRFYRARAVEFQGCTYILLCTWSGAKRRQSYIRRRRSRQLRGGFERL